MSDEISTDQINTYHCICSTLLVSTFDDLSSLPKRAETIDGASALPLRFFDSADSTRTITAFHNASVDKKPLVIKREDGFEKRTLLRCSRCDLVFGYKLDEAHFDMKVSKDRVAYILPGSLRSTGDMMAKKVTEAPSWAQET